MTKESDLVRALGQSWTAETSSDAKIWSKSNPSQGQCAVTALVVNDYLGGEIVWAPARMPNGSDVSHYFNKIGCVEKDFTRMQFPKGTKIPKGIAISHGFPSTRDYIMSYDSTRQRYEILKNKVKKLLRRSS